MIKKPILTPKIVREIIKNIKDVRKTTTKLDDDRKVTKAQIMEKYL